MVGFGGCVRDPRLAIVSHSISSIRNAIAFPMLSSHPGFIRLEQAVTLYVQVRFLHIDTKGDNSTREMRLRKRKNRELSVSARYQYEIRKGMTIRQTRKEGEKERMDTASRKTYIRHCSTRDRFRSLKRKTREREVSNFPAPEMPTVSTVLAREREGGRPT
jgi:hypothetical protein